MNNYNRNGCGGMPNPRNAETVNETALAMAYVPWQKFTNVYEPDKALAYGTIFPELNKPFLGKRGRGVYES